jgi:acetyl esterase/lipase
MKRFIIALTVSSIALAALNGCKNPSQELIGIQYGSDPRNSFDISLPAGRTKHTPVIVLIHGGAWTGGDKSDFNYLRKYFCNKGFAVISVNYRLANIRGGGFDHIFDDISDAVSLIREKSDVWVYSRDQIIVVGHSAGGHIALMYGFTRASGTFLRGVVSFCGVIDLTDPELKEMLRKMRINEAKSGGDGAYDLIEFITGGSREMEERYSPFYVIADVPVLLFSGKMETVIPWTQSARLHEKMTGRGFDSTLYIYPDMGHDLSIHYTEIMSITEKWIRDRLTNIK